MRSHLLRLEPPAAAAAVDQVEPLDAAMLEVSARIAANSDERRLLFSRVDELGGRLPSLRRKHTRPTAPAMSRPITFYSIEEAASEDVAAPLQVA